MRIANALQPGRLIPIAAAAFLSAIIAVVVAISFASLVYAGPLTPYAGRGIGLVLAGSIAVMLITALMSSYPGSVAMSQDSPAALMALTIAAISGQMASSSGETQFVTAVGAIMVATVFVGVSMLVLGAARLGSLVRFVPYPVMGGFLAGTGWLLLRGSLGVMTDLPLTAETLGRYFTPEVLVQWVPGLVFALLLFFLSRRFRHPLLLPGALVLALILFYVALAITNTSFDTASRMGLFIGQLPQGSLWQLPSPAELSAVQWPLILEQGVRLGILALVCVLSLLLNCSGVELAVARDMDLNRELRAAGLANVVSGLVGGFPGFHTVSVTLIGRYMKANSRLIGVLAALMMLVVLLVGAQFLSTFPKAILGGLIGFLGLSLFVEWVYFARRRLPRAEYAIVLLILLVIAVSGYFEGVAVGILAAVVLFLLQYSRHGVIKHMFTIETYRSTVLRAPHEDTILMKHGQCALILQMQGYVFFGTASGIFELIKEKTSHAGPSKLRYVVLDFRRVTDLDSSAMLSFSRMVQLSEQRGFVLVLTHLAPRFAMRLDISGSATDPTVRLFPELDRGVEWCENEILRAEPSIEPGQTSVHNHLIGALGEFATTVIGYMDHIEIPRGAYLVHQGEETCDLFFIDSGLLSVQLELDDGNTVRVLTAKAGTVLGEIGFYARAARTASIIAEEPSAVYVLTPEAMNQMRSDEPTAAAVMHEYLAGMLAERLSDTVGLLRAVLD